MNFDTQPPIEMAVRRNIVYDSSALDQLSMILNGIHTAVLRNAAEKCYLENRTVVTPADVRHVLRHAIEVATNQTGGE